jgi:hypothetical protein
MVSHIPRQVASSGIIFGGDVENIGVVRLASFLFKPSAYQMSVTLPVIVPNVPWLFLIIIVSALATSISTLLAEEIHMMCVPGVLLDPPVMRVMTLPAYDSKPSQYMPALGRCNKLT